MMFDVLQMELDPATLSKVFRAASTKEKHQSQHGCSRRPATLERDGGLEYSIERDVYSGRAFSNSNDELDTTTTYTRSGRYYFLA